MIPLRACLLASVLAAPTVAEALCTDDAMLVFDGSGSMAEMGFNRIGEPRIIEARRAVAAAVPEIAELRRLGLVVYGPGGADYCDGVELRFGPVVGAGARIVGEVEALQPAGDTALTVAVARAAEALDYTRRAGDIVLVTDGKETCGGRPCVLAAELAAEAADLRVHVIGFKVRGDFFSWPDEGATDYVEAESVARCLADRTGGIYVDAETVDDLIAALRQTLGCQLLF